MMPFIVAIPILFTDMSQYNDPRINPVGLRNFTALFTDSSVQADYIPAVRRTLIFVLLTSIPKFGIFISLLCLLMGFGALLTGRMAMLKKLRAQGFF